MTKKLLCSKIDCESESFELLIVKKEYIIVLCSRCGTKTRIHRSHISNIFGSKLNGEQIKEVLEYDLEK